MILRKLRDPCREVMVSVTRICVSQLITAIDLVNFINNTFYTYDSDTENQVSQPSVSFLNLCSYRYKV